MNPSMSMSDVLLMIGKVRLTNASEEFICNGPKNNAEVVLRNSAGKALTRVKFVCGSVGSSRSVGTYVRFGYNAGGYPISPSPRAIGSAYGKMISLETVVFINPLTLPVSFLGKTLICSKFTFGPPLANADCVSSIALAQFEDDVFPA